ncbi:MAG TPA: hypothetical protein ENN58_00790, partial [bacterium]|nr:hypothetical protein [bacterium]
LYQSGWYITLLFLFAANTLVCTFTRLSPKLKKAVNPNIQVEKKNLIGLKIHGQFKIKGDYSHIKNNLLIILSQSRFKTREKEEKNQTFLHARKKTLGFFGSDFVHLGIIIILLGGILSGITGVRFNLVISEGETHPIPGADFQIRLDKFTTEYYPNGNVKDWKSNLTVIDNQKDMLSRTIEVNHPLSYKGYVFYQSSYGFNWNNPSISMEISSKGPNVSQDVFTFSIGETIKLSDGITEIKAVYFVPDFVIDENKKVASRSNQPNNPAVFIEGYQGDERIFSGWFFAKFPDFSQMHSREENPFTIELKNVKGSEYSGLQIAKDPGVNFIWTGSSVLMLGLLLAFYWPPKEIKFILTQTKDGADVLAGGLTTKNRDAFRDEFEHIMRSSRSGK